MDTIQDGGGEADVVLFDPGIAPASIAVSRDSQDADSIILTVGQTGSSIKLAGQLASPESAIEEVRFSDGTVWTGEEIRERLLDGASTTGDDLIEEPDSTTRSMPRPATILSGRVAETISSKEERATTS